MFDPPVFHQLCEDGRRELTSAVTCYYLGDSVGGDPSMREGVDHCLCVDVRYWDSDGPSTESVNKSEEMVESIRIRHGYEVDVDVLETFGRNSEFTDWRHDMSLDLGLLAGQTFSGPFTNVLFDVGPYEFIGYGFSRTLHSRVTKAMDNVENSTTIRKRHKWSCWAIGDVDE